MLILPDTLPIARYRFTFRITHDLRLPPFAGSTLRGVFGHALREQVCTCGQAEHHPKNCPYSHIFTAPHNHELHRSQQNTPPQPYVFEPPLNGKTHYAAGEDFTFQLVLFGQVRLMLPLIVSALRHAFAKGVGERNRGTGELSRLAVQNGDEWHEIQAAQHIIPHTNHLVLPTEFASDLRLYFYTPLRIQQHGKIVPPAQMSPDLIARQTMRRVSSIAQLYFAAPLQADYAALSAQAATLRGEHAWHWHDWQRYSNRQQQMMKLGGIMGESVWRDVPREWAALLHIGQWLHIGKETVFGLGGYRVQAA